MNTISRSAFAAAVFLFGCATGGAASQYVASANAQHAPPPDGGMKCEYHCFKDDGSRSIEKRGNDAGSKGWELAASALAGGADMSSPIWCFKRPYR